MFHVKHCPDMGLFLRLPGTRRLARPRRPGRRGTGGSLYRVSRHSPNLSPRPSLLSRRRHRHRVDKSLPGRHSRPADAGRECRSLPTRPAGRHFGRRMSAGRCLSAYSIRGSTMSLGCSSRNPSSAGPLRVTAASVTMAVACTIVSSTWAGGVPGKGKGCRSLSRPAFAHRHARTCSGHDAIGAGAARAVTGGAPVADPRRATRPPVELSIQAAMKRAPNPPAPPLLDCAKYTPKRVPSQAENACSR